MKCPFCKHGITAKGTTTVTLDRPPTTVVFRDVPADVCENCGEAFVDSPTAGTLLSQAEAAARAGAGVEVRSFAA